MNRSLIVTFLSFLFFGKAFSGVPMKEFSPGDYINIFYEDAVKEMIENGVPASVTLAQGMLESGYGNSPLAVYANNHFGLKCHKEWEGSTFSMDDDEKNECFRKYDNVIESYFDHSLFLKTRERYSFLFNLSLTDYSGWARGLKDAGYATHPNYATDIVDIIEKYRLYELDRNGFIPEVTEINAYKNSTSEKLLKMKKENSVNKINNKHTILKFNKSECVIVKPGDTYMNIAREFSMSTGSLKKNNDFDFKKELLAGEKIYLKPKRSKGPERFHMVSKGETMEYISQLYGIKLNSLYEKNRMKPGTQPKADDILYLRKRKPAN
ncbi:MAG: glucosaminidase domain-containing protein [Bacteroidia bacterium]